MTPERWREVRSVLEASLELPAGQRSAYLDNACAGKPEIRGEVEELLAAAEHATRYLESPAVATRVELVDDLGPGSNLGPYRLVEEIGRGGLGAVYLALRDDGVYTQQVAVKVIQRGMDTEMLLERFRYERQILAFLNHPNIARLFDGGSAPDGRPYFVMEYVPGRPVTDYCAARELDRRERLELFRRVCAAVEHAHRNLVVHRDLKPSNILVTEDGQPKLLDFGIAKLIFPQLGLQTSAQTAGSRLMTPEYASPEQVRGEQVTTATDVYSLGAVLYEMLTGRRAHRFPSPWPADIERVVCREDPPRPSVAVAGKAPHPSLQTRALSGDLDRIVMKALSKDPGQRYSSVEQFSEDLRRHLAGLPVTAREDTFFYRAGKFILRHKAGAVSALVLLGVLLGGGLTTVWQAHAARQQRDRAQRLFEDSRKLVNAFLVEHDALASLPGGTAIRSNLIRQSLGYLDRLAQESGGDPVLRQEVATAYEKMGDVQGRPDGPNVGDAAGALESYRKALAIRESLAAEDPRESGRRRDLAESYARLAAALKLTGDYEAGLDYDRKSLAAREELLAADPANRALRRLVADNYTSLGGSLSQVGDWEGVLEARRKALALYQELAASGRGDSQDYRGLALAHIRMGSILNRNKAFPEAREHYGKALEIARKGIEEHPANLHLRLAEASAMSGSGRVWQESGQTVEALAQYRSAHALVSELAAADPQDARIHSLLAASHHRIGGALLDLGRSQEAVAEFEAALAIRERLAALNPMNAGARGEVAESQAGLGDANLVLGRRVEARAAYQKALHLLGALEQTRRANSASKAELDRVRKALDRLGR